MKKKKKTVTTTKQQQKTVRSTKHEKTRVDKSWLVLILNIIGWESSACFPDQLQGRSVKTENENGSM